MASHEKRRFRFAVDLISQPVQDDLETTIIFLVRIMWDVRQRGSVFAAHDPTQMLRRFRCVHIFLLNIWG